MSVYVDPIFHHKGPHGWTDWCHMWADTQEELHAMAAQIGMKREWFQDRPNAPHYDLIPRVREKAVRLGAVEVGALEVGRWIRRNATAKKLPQEQETA